jgi:mono/diheme cytochrome c family protein
MHPWKPAFATIGLIMAAAVQPSSAQSMKGDAAAGQRFAETWCSGCHAVELRTTRSGGVAPDFVTIANRRKTTARWLNKYLYSQHEKMPNFEIELTDAADVTAFILSLKRKKN